MHSFNLALRSFVFLSSSVTAHLTSVPTRAPRVPKKKKKKTHTGNVADEQVGEQVANKQTDW